MPSEKQNDKPRAVLDSNVLISSLHFRKGILAGIWPPLAEGRYVLVLSPAILAETLEKLRDKFDWEAHEIDDTFNDLLNKAEFVFPDVIPNAVPDDPDDNHIVACALEGRADMIVSGDGDLTRLGEYEGIPIIRPADFLRMVKEPVVLSKNSFE